MGEITRILSGVPGLLDWYRSGRAAVAPEQSTARAGSCVACPKNSDAPLTEWFTEPVSAALRKEIEKRADYHLQTPYDACLGICTACFCPLKTKVHEPIDLVLKHLTPEVECNLWERCWIIHETNKPTEDQTTHEHESDKTTPRRRTGLFGWYRRWRGLPDP